MCVFVDAEEATGNIALYLLIECTIEVFFCVRFNGNKLTERVKYTQKVHFKCIEFQFN